jgi:hypothetical protein
MRPRAFGLNVDPVQLHVEPAHVSPISRFNRLDIERVIGEALDYATVPAEVLRKAQR